MIRGPQRSSHSVEVAVQWNRFNESLILTGEIGRKGGRAKLLRRNGLARQGPTPINTCLGNKIEVGWTWKLDQFQLFVCSSDTHLVVSHISCFCHLICHTTKIKFGLWFYKVISGYSWSKYSVWDLLNWKFITGRTGNSRIKRSSQHQQNLPWLAYHFMVSLDVKIGFHGGKRKGAMRWWWRC